MTEERPKCTDSPGLLDSVCRVFDGKIMASLSPESPLGGFTDVLVTWSAIRKHPAWQKHPGISHCLKAPRIIGYTRLGDPISVARHEARKGSSR